MNHQDHLIILKITLSITLSVALIISPHAQFPQTNLTSLVDQISGHRLHLTVLN